jgi:hypothetical protein
MKISEILETDKIFEVLKTNNKVPKTIKPIKVKKPSKKMIRPIGSQAPLPPEKVRIQSKKENAERAEDAVKKERVVQKWNKEQRSD